MELRAHIEIATSDPGLAAADTRAWSSLESLGVYVYQVPSNEHIRRV